MKRELERHRGLAPENDAGKDILRGGFEPCLLALLRLSVGRDPGTDLTGGWLPTALARTGHLVRAAELAYTISNEFFQGRELLELVKAAAGAGDLCGAQALAESIPVRQVRDQALVVLVPAWARAGERDRAVALAERIRYPHHWGMAWAMLAKAVADSGDTEEALRFADRADDAVRSFSAGADQALALLMEVAAATGDQDRAAALADRVEDFTRSRNPTGWSRPRPLAVVLAHEVLGGDLDRLDALLRRPPRPAVGAGDTTDEWELDETADQDTVLEEDPDEVHLLLDSPRSPLEAWDLACVLDAVAETADQDVALALADRAETLLETGDGRDHDILLEAVTRLLARRGQVERAMALADWIDPHLRVGRQAEIVRELARYGDTDAAEALAHAITDRRAQARALIELVRELARRGELDRAEAIVPVITDRWAQGEALVAVARELARRGDLDRAEALTCSIAYRATRARALAALAESAQPSHACRLAAQAMVLDGWNTVLPVLERIMPRSVVVVVDQMMS
jgi:tetratricopeptide (TPR) repeat protein